MTQKNRRLCDKILIAFHQACDQGELDTAEHLLRALELSLSHFGGPQATEKRDHLGPVAEAHSRLLALRAPHLRTIAN